MVLIDKQIRIKIESCNLIENYTRSNIQSVLYDLVADSFIEHSAGENLKHSDFTLLPQQSIVVATKEIINLPKDIIGRITGRNSRIREGLLVESPVYQPGHHTRVYFRLTNVSNTSIQLKHDCSYASIMFEQLDEFPDRAYEGTYQDELDYSHLGDYSSEYLNEISAVEKKIDEFKNFEKSVYANVITILTVFVAIFSIINVNVSFAGSCAQKWSNLVIFNLCTIGSISVLANLMLHHLLPNSFKRWTWIIPVLCFAGALACLFIPMCLA